MSTKKSANQTSSPNNSPANDTSTTAQRARLLAQLKLEPVDTFTARRELNIIHPGGRVAELRAAGHSIQTQRISLTDDQGRTHHGIALYFLSPSAAPAQTEA
ncbi:helix-turn-helix domain-containing protein [Pseudomonas sp. GM48]|uniref:helix-turn-helix domain-containing protein n=1 Tax=Pseudomonas sp. GM48 TaxID=1144330 RepID=UPI0002701057|nr:helix-turn-helix domain-containing protein [Pseudomonas sp. GM48]EJM53856.1 hypothetical protein PMI28_03979 [Pseudomonas sp. GM48]